MARLHGPAGAAPGLVLPLKGSALCCRATAGLVWCFEPICLPRHQPRRPTSHCWHIWQEKAGALYDQQHVRSVL